MPCTLSPASTGTSLHQGYCLPRETHERLPLDKLCCRVGPEAMANSSHPFGQHYKDLACERGESALRKSFATITAWSDATNDERSTRVRGLCSLTVEQTSKTSLPSTTIGTVGRLKSHVFFFVTMRAPGLARNFVRRKEEEESLETGFLHDRPKFLGDGTTGRWSTPSSRRLMRSCCCARALCV